MTYPGGRVSFPFAFQKSCLRQPPPQGATIAAHLWGRFYRSQCPEEEMPKGDIILHLGCQYEKWTMRCVSSTIYWHTPGLSYHFLYTSLYHVFSFFRGLFPRACWRLLVAGKPQQLRCKEIFTLLAGQVTASRTKFSHSSFLHSLRVICCGQKVTRARALQCRREDQERSFLSPHWQTASEAK